MQDFLSLTFDDAAIFLIFKLKVGLHFDIFLFAVSVLKFDSLLESIFIAGMLSDIILT